MPQHARKRVTLIALLLLSGFACAKGEETSTAICPTSEDLSASDSTVTMATALRVAQSAGPSGIVGQSIQLSNVRLFMTSNGLSQVQLKLYRVTTSELSTSGYKPDQGTLLSTTTLTSGLGASTAVALDFPISPTVTLSVAPQNRYSFVVVGTGGSYTINQNSTQTISGFMQKEISTNFWSSFLGGSLSMILTYSGCNSN